ncbi:MAG: hypothetical protein ACRENB_10785 [Gemmatimonadales bacterium]
MEFRDLSKLPADRRYWDALESRITADLASELHSLAGRSSGWWGPVARRAGVLAGLAVAAGIAALFLVPARPTERAVAPTGILRAPEDDPAMIAFVTAPEPPSLASLVISRPGAGR